MNNPASSLTSEGDLLAQMTVAVRAKDFSACLQKTKDLLRDAQVMMVVPNPEKPATLQPIVITYQTLARGVFQPSGLADQAATANIRSIYMVLPPITPAKDYEAIRPNINLQGIIAGNGLQKGDLVVLLSVAGRAETIQRTLSGLRGIIFVSPPSLGLHRRESPWLFSYYLIESSLGSLEAEINDYFRKRKLPIAAHKNAIEAMRELYEETKRHHPLPLTPHKNLLKWGRGLY